MKKAYDKAIEANSFTLLKAGEEYQTISENGKYVATENKEQTVIIYKLDNTTEFLISNRYKINDEYQEISGQVKKPYFFYTHDAPIVKLWFSPDSEYIASQDRSCNLIIHDLKTKEMVYNGPYLTDLQFRSYTNEIFYRTYNVKSSLHTIVSKNLETNEEKVYKYDIDYKPPFCLSHDGELFACHYKEINEFIIKNLQTHDFTRIKIENNNTIMDLDFGPNNKHLLCSHQTKNTNSYFITVYSIALEEAIFTCETKQSIKIEKIALSPNSEYLFYVYEPCNFFSFLRKRYLVIHNLEKKEKKELSIHPDEDSPIFSPDYKKVVFMKKHSSKEICAYNLKTKKKSSFRGYFTHKLFTPNSKKLITSTIYTPLCLYDIKKKRLESQCNHTQMSQVSCLTSIPYGLDSIKIIALDKKSCIKIFVKKNKKIKQKYSHERAHFLLDSENTTKKRIILNNKSFLTSHTLFKAFSKSGRRSC